MRRRFGAWMAICLIGAASLGGPGSQAQQQGLDVYSRDQLSGMLRDAFNEVKKHYYDPSLHGLDWDARYTQYKARLAAVHNLGQGFRLVAAFLSGLQDSHTYFVPPSRPARYEPGYRLSIIGDACFVTRVRPKTDAESKVHVGDQVLAVDGYDVNRVDFEDLSYMLHVLSPQAPVQLELRSPIGETRTVTVAPTVYAEKRILDFSGASGDFDWQQMRRHWDDANHLARNVVVERDDLAIFKIRTFMQDAEELNNAMARVAKHPAVIIDLRGNGGGRIDALEYLLGFFFDHDVQIARRVGRDQNEKPQVAKPHGKAYAGKVFVLLDAQSASASELFARVMQLEHRGIVIGDRSAGAVMEARGYSESQGADTKIFYAFSITDANLLMADGQSLERHGVTPDELAVPTGADLAAERDPVLALAAKRAGVNLDPHDAGKMFPVEWMPL